MATATASKERATTAPRKSAADSLVEERQRERRDDFDRFRQNAADKYAAEVAVLNDILEANDSLESRDISLTTGQRIVVEDLARRDFKSGAFVDIVRVLRRHRSECRLREQYGDPAVLHQAEAELAEAQRLERETAAVISDLDVDDTGDDAPNLHKQIVALQRKLAGLTSARAEAERKVARIRGGRETLRNRAPEWLKKEVDRELSMVQRASPCWREFMQIKSLMRRHEQFRWFMDPEFSRRSRGELTIRHYCREFIPSALREGRGYGDPPEYADIEAVHKFIANDLPGILAELQATRWAAAAEWQKIRAEVEAPLERFVQYGIVSD